MFGNQIVSGSSDMTIRVWDLDEGPGWSRGSCRRTIAGHSGAVRCLQASATRIVSGSYDATLRIWDMITGRCLHVLRGHAGAVLSLRFDDARIVSGGMDCLIRIWDHAGHCLQTLAGHRGGVTSIHFSPEDQVLRLLQPLPRPLPRPLYLYLMPCVASTTTAFGVLPHM